MSNGIIQSSGAEIEPGDWLYIKFTDAEYVGRFSGIYENPNLGLMFRLAFARKLDDPVTHDTVYCVIRPTNKHAEALDSAVVIDKPQFRSGKLSYRPRRPEGTILH